MGCGVALAGRVQPALQAMVTEYPEGASRNARQSALERTGRKFLTAHGAASSLGRCDVKGQAA